ncbi:MAG: ATP-dependent helicase [Pyrinomonadaceae bacterium]|nr:ATP-dependent helicase [Pyrinomonadaceae bacterium]
MNETWWVDPKDLNDEQRSIIELPLGGSHLITGPPGSGKTNLLLLRANYMTLADQPNVLILVFTKTLQEFIASGGRQYAFSGTKVQTCMKWEQGFLHSFGVTLAPPSNFEDKRLYYLLQVQKLLSAGKGKEFYDAIFLDEAQDYLPDEIRVFKTLAKVIFASAHSKQKIYDGVDTTPLLESLTDQQHKLHYHYRIGRRICKLADALVTGHEIELLLPASNYNEVERPSSVEDIRCANLDEEIAKITEALSVQVRAYPDELLGVISPGKETAVRIWEALAETDLGPISVLQISGEHAPFESGTRICVATVHSAKGLEFRALHIAECNDFDSRRHERNLAYTAITRAKTSLSLYSSEPLPGYLEKALRALEPLSDLPNLAQVFGKKPNVD